VGFCEDWWTFSVPKLSSSLSLCLLSSLSPVPFPHLLYTTFLLLFCLCIYLFHFLFLLYPNFSSFCLSIFINIIITFFSFSPFLLPPPPLFGWGGHFSVNLYLPLNLEYASGCCCFMAFTCYALAWTQPFSRAQKRLVASKILCSAHFKCMLHSYCQ